MPVAVKICLSQFMRCARDSGRPSSSINKGPGALPTARDTPSWLELHREDGHPDRYESPPLAKRATRHEMKKLESGKIRRKHRQIRKKLALKTLAN